MILAFDCFVCFISALIIVQNKLESPCESVVFSCALLKTANFA